MQTTPRSQDQAPGPGAGGQHNGMRTTQRVHSTQIESASLGITPTTNPYPSASNKRASAAQKANKFIFNDINNLKVSLKKNSALVQPLFGASPTL